MVVEKGQPHPFSQLNLRTFDLWTWLYLFRSCYSVCISSSRAIVLEVLFRLRLQSALGSQGDTIAMRLFLSKGVPQTIHFNTYISSHGNIWNSFSSKFIMRRREPYIETTLRVPLFISLFPFFWRTCKAVPANMKKLSADRLRCKTPSRRLLPVKTEELQGRPKTIWWFWGASITRMSSASSDSDEEKFICNGVVGE